MRTRLLRVLEVLLLVGGLLAVGAWALSRAETALAQREARVRFEQALAADEGRETVASLPSPDAPEPRRHDWAPGRIEAYLQSLSREADPVAILEIPEVDLSVMVLPGTDDWTLDRGVGLVEGSPPPGAPGNVSIAGHRDGFFRVLRDVERGDAIRLRTLDGTYDYRVAWQEVVEPDRVDVLGDTDEPSLTLVTCYPFYYVGSAPQRFIVRAVRR